MDVQELIDEGLELLEIQDFEGALRVGGQIIEARHTYGHEISARAYWELGKKEQAFAILDDGVAKAPQAWGLWELLGNFHSDEENFERAFECYERALGCSTAFASGIHLNYAIALQRQERFEESLGHLDRVDDDESAPAAAVVRAQVLNSLERHDEAIEAAEGALELDPDEDDRAFLHQAIATAHWRRGEAQEALRSAWNAIAADRSNEGAQWLIRELEGQRSERASLWEVVLRGRWSKPIDDEGTVDYHVSYNVVADDADEAVRLASRFEPAEVRGSLSEPETTRKRASAGLKGVYWTSGRIFFRETDE